MSVRNSHAFLSQLFMAASPAAAAAAATSTAAAATLSSCCQWQHQRKLGQGQLPTSRPSPAPPRMLQRDLHICHLRLLVGDFCIGWLQQQLLQLPHTKIRISNSPLSWLCLLHAQNWTAAAVADAVESSRVRASQFARVKCKRCCCCCCLQHLTVKAHSRTAFKWWLPPSLCAVCQITLELNDWIQFAIENTPPTKTETRLDLTQVIWS